MFTFTPWLVIKVQNDYGLLQYLGLIDNK